jgi:hypothetical protein
VRDSLTWSAVRGWAVLLLMRMRMLILLLLMPMDPLRILREGLAFE